MYIPKNRKCPECGKEFYCPDGDWVYKIQRPRLVYLCSWKCFLARERKLKGKRANVQTEIHEDD